MLQYTELAKQRLSEDCASFDQALYQSELTWFMKITWNIALQAGDAYSEMRKAFDTCQKVSLVFSITVINFSNLAVFSHAPY